MNFKLFVIFALLIVWSGSSMGVTEPDEEGLLCLLGGNDACANYCSLFGENGSCDEDDNCICNPKPPVTA